MLAVNLCDAPVVVHVLEDAMTTQCTSCLWQFVFSSISIDFLLGFSMNNKLNGQVDFLGSFL